MLLTTWFLAPQITVFASLFIAAIFFLPPVLSAIGDLLRKPNELPPLLHFKAVVLTCGRQLAQALLTLIFLPFEAAMSLDAINRTMVRLLFTRKNLLQWQTAKATEQAAQCDPGGFYTRMWIGPALAVMALTFLFLNQFGLLMLAGPILLLWAASPWLAWWLSQPLKIPESGLSSRQVDFLRNTARRTWRYFETFVVLEENWLPPDNFQEEPARVLASRTSPTNMGLALLANLAACDFGYLPVGQLLQRTRDALSTMRRLERHRGHFYNWYIRAP